MDRLASCYFCGTALDDSLGEFAVVPRDLDPDEQRRVVLCRGCREKLSPIIEHVAEAAMSAGAASADPTPERVEDPSGAGAPADADASEAASLDSQPVKEAARDESPPTEDPDVSAASASGQAASGGSETAASGDSDGAAREDSAGSTGGAAAPAPDDEASTSPSEDDASANASDDGPSLSKLEYNKVMRLLENREFPVDRAEFRSVATSAYEISRKEFQAVIEASIKKGLLAETEDGQLVRGENA